MQLALRSPDLSFSLVRQERADVRRERFDLDHARLLDGFQAVEDSVGMSASLATAIVSMLYSSCRTITKAMPKKGKRE